MTDRTEFVEKFAETYNLPRVMVQEATDMAFQALAKALEAGEAAVNLHHDTYVRALASVIFLDLMRANSESKEMVKTLTIAFLMKEKSREA